MRYVHRVSSSHLCLSDLVVVPLDLHSFDLLVSLVKKPYALSHLLGDINAVQCGITAWVKDTSHWYDFLYVGMVFAV